MRILLEYTEPNGTKIKIEQDLNICQYVVKINTIMFGKKEEEAWNETARFTDIIDLLKYLNGRLKWEF